LGTVLLALFWFFIYDVVELLDLCGFVKDFEGFFVVTFSFAMVLFLFEKDVCEVKVAI
jgi:hypothetical protein